MIYQHSKHYNTKIMLQSNPIHKQSYKLHQYSFITLNFDSFFHPITNLSLAINWILYINIKILAKTITNFSNTKHKPPTLTKTNCATHKNVIYQHSKHYNDKILLSIPIQHTNKPTTTSIIIITLNTSTKTNCATHKNVLSTFQTLQH